MYFVNDSKRLIVVPHRTGAGVSHEVIATKLNTPSYIQCGDVRYPSPDEPIRIATEADFVEYRLSVFPGFQDVQANVGKGVTSA